LTPPKKNGRFWGGVKGICVLLRTGIFTVHKENFLQKYFNPRNHYILGAENDKKSEILFIQFLMFYAE
jgi:hypothetical protein